MAEFLSFKFIDGGEERGKLLADFLADANNKKLRDVVKGVKAIKFGFHQSLDDSGLFLVMVKASFDKVLIELGKKHNFPRGFPVLWKPKSADSIRYNENVIY